MLVDADSMPGARWFPDARLNFAENMLKRRRGGEALVFWGEDKVKRRLTHRQLYDRVSVLAQAMGPDKFVRIGVAGDGPLAEPGSSLQMSLS